MLWIGALALQLLLTLFAPPFFAFGHSLYLGDFWMLLWAPALLGFAWPEIPRDRRRSAMVALAVLAGALLVAWAHGRYRPDLVAALGPSLGSSPPAPETLRYQPWRELGVALRFLSWAIAGFAVALGLPIVLEPGEKRKARRALSLVLGAGILVSVLPMDLVHLLPGVELPIGRWYGYDPSRPELARHALGFFRSPNEAGIALAYAALLTLQSGKVTAPARLLLAAIAAVGVVLTQALVPVIAAIAAIGLAFLLPNRKASGAPRKWAVIGLQAAVAIGLTLTVPAGYLAQKLGNFSDRVSLWKSYLHVAAQRPDYLMFGTGFHPLHTDQAYLFLLSRGGLLLLGVALLWIARKLRFSWAALGWADRMVVLFPLVSALALDSLIMRPLVVLWITVALPNILLSSSAAAKGDTPKGGPT